MLLTPTGPLVYVDAAATPYVALRTIPDVVTRHLVAAGVTEAVITSPRPGPLFGGREGLRHVPRAVVLRLYPPQPTPPAVGERRAAPKVLPPKSWVDEAVAWVRDGLGDDAELLAAIEVVEFPLAVDQVRGFFDQAARSEASWAVVVAGEMDRRLRGANGCFLLDPNLAMAAGGPEASDDELVEIFEVLVALGRRLAPEVGYAFVAIDPTFGGFEKNFPVCEKPPGGASPQDIRNLLEEVVPDGFPWQVLGPGTWPAWVRRPRARSPWEVADSSWRWAVPAPGSSIPRHPRTPSLRRVARG